MKKMRAYVNVLKMRVNMALNREYVYNYPVQAYIEPTLFCNLRCPACPTGLQLGLRPSATIKWDLFKSAIDEIGDYVFSLYMYNWGEPLLHRQTPEMIQYAKTKDMNIVMSTNLSLKLSDDYIERLVRSGLDRLIVSLDGTTAEAYARYRLRGDFDLVRENMLRIQEAKKNLGVRTPEVVWQFLVFKHNEDQIDEALTDFKEWGADTIVTEGAIMPFAPYDEGFEPSTIPRFNMYHPDHHFQKETAWHDRSGRPCSWLYGIFVLNPNGKVSPCCASAGEQTDFGEYSGTGGFFDVWNNTTFKRARKLFGKSGPPTTNGSAGKSENDFVQIQTNSSKRLAENAADLVAGMAANLSASLKVDELICQKCPIPWRQDDVDHVIAEEANSLISSYKEQKSIKDKARLLLAYLLIGAPNWKSLARISFVRWFAAAPSFNRR
jgi:MoaA/NifB/PqqE/SkfB family radical SAM enzyme